MKRYLVHEAQNQPQSWTTLTELRKNLMVKSRRWCYSLKPKICEMELKTLNESEKTTRSGKAEKWWTPGVIIQADETV